MSKAMFSIVCICKNEANTLPKMLESLKEFREKYSGEVVLLDTGSTDNSVEIAKSYGVNVHEVGEMFIETIDDKTATEINKRFVSNKESDIVKAGSRLFNFAAARNHVSSLASNDFIITMDCDEAYSVFNIERINSLIENGVDQFEYQFIYAHNGDGSAAVQFVQSKAFNRKKLQWTGAVHEVLYHTAANVRREYVHTDVILLEHWQEQGKEHRGNYIVGLGYDCFLNPKNDRNLFYLARECMYTNRFHSAIKLFERHQEMNGWAAERAQGLIYIGDCYSYLGMQEKQLEYYNKAFTLDPNRRESLIKSAYVMKSRGQWNGVCAYAAGALEIGNSGYYANDIAHYTHIPHELLYEAKIKLGDLPAAQWHLMKCLKYQPYNSKFINDTKNCFEYPCNTLDGWMSYEEQLFLYNLGKRFSKGKIAEIGSYKGKSTVAIASGCKDGTVYAIDTWEGSQDPRDDTSWLYKTHDVFSEFQKNIEAFGNIVPIQMDGCKASESFPDNTFDAVFIDAEHTKEAVIKDIQSWLPKIKSGGIICGHDYKYGDAKGNGGWMTVIDGVNEVFGTPDEVHDTIWVKYKK